MKIKSDIQEIINREAKSLQALAAEAENLEMKQREVEMIYDRRQELCTDPRGLPDESVINKMLNDFTGFSEGLQNDEDELIRIGKLIQSPTEDAGQLMERTQVRGKIFERNN